MLANGVGRCIELTECKSSETFTAVRCALDELFGHLFVGLGLGFPVRNAAAQAAGGTGETELETRSQERESVVADVDTKRTHTE